MNVEKQVNKKNYSHLNCKTLSHIDLFLKYRQSYSLDTNNYLPLKMEFQKIGKKDKRLFRIKITNKYIYIYNVIPKILETFNYVYLTKMNNYKICSYSYDTKCFKIARHLVNKVRLRFAEFSSDNRLHSFYFKNTKLFVGKGLLSSQFFYTNPFMLYNFTTKKYVEGLALYNVRLKLHKYDYMINYNSDKTYLNDYTSDYIDKNQHCKIKIGSEVYNIPSRSLSFLVSDYGIVNSNILLNNIQKFAKVK